MAFYKEIVTKTVVGKGKKVTTNKHEIKPEEKPDTVLGCWVINHKFNGNSQNGTIYVNGTYDVNIWYSYDNDSKTGVSYGSFSYQDKMNVPLSNGHKLSNNSEVIVNSLTDPNVIEANVEGDTIKFEIRKETGVEVVDDTKIRVNVENNFDDYVEILDDVSEEVLEKIDKEVDENYLTN